MCKLEKTLYRFKQSPRAWYHCINSFFINEGFNISQADHSLYIKQTFEYLLVTIIYMDDLIILVRNLIQMKWLKSDLEKDFEMRDFKELQYCRGVEFERNRKSRTIIMNQKSYIEGLLKRFKFEKCKLVITSFDANLKLFKFLDEEFGNVKREMEGVPYEAGVGSLMYALVLRGPILYLQWVQWTNLCRRPVHHIGWPWNVL